MALFDIVLEDGFNISNNHTFGYVKLRDLEIQISKTLLKFCYIPLNLRNLSSCYLLLFYPH